MPTTVLRPLVLLAFALSLSGVASAQNIQLRWVPPTTPGVVGYNVYVGPTAAGPLVATPIDVGLPATDATGVASAVVVGNRSIPLSIEMTAYDAQRRESVRSNRVFLVPGGESLGDPLYSESFQALAAGANPAAFVDLGGNFLVRQYANGNRAYATPVASGVTSSRYLGPSRSWPSYEISGRMFVPSGGRIGGVAVRVTNPGLSQAFLFGGDSRGVFALDQRGNPPLRCASSASTGVSVVGNTTYRVRLRFTKPGGRARLRAKAWRETDTEPSAWQADCWTDTALTYDLGPFALYREGSGETWWDDLVVRPVLGTFDPIP